MQSTHPHHQGMTAKRLPVFDEGLDSGVAFDFIIAMLSRIAGHLDSLPPIQLLPRHAPRPLSPSPALPMVPHTTTAAGTWSGCCPGPCLHCGDERGIGFHYTGRDVSAPLTAANS